MSESNRIDPINADGEPINAAQCASTLDDHLSSVFSSADTNDALKLPYPAAVTIPGIEISPGEIFKRINDVKVSS